MWARGGLDEGEKTVSASAVKMGDTVAQTWQLQECPYSSLLSHCPEEVTFHTNM